MMGLMFMLLFYELNEVNIMKKIFCLFVIISIVWTFTSCQIKDDEITCTECGEIILQSNNYCSNCVGNVKVTVSDKTPSQIENIVLSKDEMLEVAETIDIKTLDQSRNNIVKAKQEYGDKVMKVTGGFVSKIEEDHVTLISEIKYSGDIKGTTNSTWSLSYDDQTINVYMGEDDLANISFADEIIVVGLITTNFEELEYELEYGGNIKVFVMENAYLIQ